MAPPLTVPCIWVDNIVGVGVRRENPPAGKMTPTREYSGGAHFLRYAPSRDPCNISNCRPFTGPGEEVCSGGVFPKMGLCDPLPTIEFSRADRGVLARPTWFRERKGAAMRLLNDHRSPSRRGDEHALAQDSGGMLDRFNYEVVYADGRSFVSGNGRPAFSFLVRDSGHYEWFIRV